MRLQAYQIYLAHGKTITYTEYIVKILGDHVEMIGASMQKRLDPRPEDTGVGRDRHETARASRKKRPENITRSSVYLGSRG